ncbi:hypothetical protein I4F81_003431 [Pyropia yezoensis]|uniref:Uncharacterized protein n=1 Tax=Pyropia yezoensis TaxID=2788 RepID=A0ACC3BSJ4_PYRYE|nr:hypothetical protein I4F81_003431 [Neopyropia yezoensis]
MLPVKSGSMAATGAAAGAGAAASAAAAASPPPWGWARGRRGIGHPDDNHSSYTDMDGDRRHGRVWMDVGSDRGGGGTEEAAVVAAERMTALPVPLSPPPFRP